MRVYYERPDNCMICEKPFEENEGLPISNYFIWTCTYTCYLDYIRECNKIINYYDSQPWDY